MKLIQKEMIRLQKETHLLEHGFYDEDISLWLRENYNKKESRVELENPKEKGHIIYHHTWLFNSNCLDGGKIRKWWFMTKFPEFFEKDAD